MLGRPTRSVGRLRRNVGRLTTRQDLEGEGRRRKNAPSPARVGRSRRPLGALHSALVSAVGEAGACGRSATPLGVLFAWNASFPVRPEALKMELPHCPGRAAGRPGRSAASAILGCAGSPCRPVRRPGVRRARPPGTPPAPRYGLLESLVRSSGRPLDVLNRPAGFIQRLPSPPPPPAEGVLRHLIALGLSQRRPSGAFFTYPPDRVAEAVSRLHRASPGGRLPSVAEPEKGPQCVETGRPAAQSARN